MIGFDIQDISSLEKKKQLMKEKQLNFLSFFPQDFIFSFIPCFQNPKKWNIQTRQKEEKV